MTARRWTQVSDLVPGLCGKGVVYAAPDDYDDIGLALLGAGYAIHAIDGAGLTNHSDTLPAVAQALSLPGAADRNLDALMDSLRDLARWVPEQDRVALLWRNAEDVIEADPALWDQIADVLAAASEELWTGGAAGDVVFETVVFVRGHGVHPLRDRHGEAADGPIGIGSPDRTATGSPDRTATGNPDRTATGNPDRSDAGDDSRTQEDDA